jgi:LemA protein
MTAATAPVSTRGQWRGAAARRMLRNAARLWSVSMGTIITLVILAAIVFWGIGMYNNLVSSRNRVRNAFSQIDVQLTRRHDLIPNLVEAVKGYMSHERNTLEAVITARNAAVAGLKKAAADPSDAEAIKALAAAETSLSGTLGRLFALAEAYPDLKASQNMQHFQEELASTENKVAFARQAFNDAVMSYNNACQNFPSNLIASNFDFKTAEFLEIDQPQKRDVPKVSFG